MKGTVTYKGRTETFNGITNIPLCAVSLYTKENPTATEKDVLAFFAPGLPGRAVSNFLIAKDVYDALPKGDDKRDRFHPRETVTIAGREYHVSNQFANMYRDQNIPVFVKHITENGFSVFHEYAAPTAVKPDAKAVSAAKAKIAKATSAKGKSGTSSLKVGNTHKIRVDRVSQHGIAHGPDHDGNYVRYDTRVSDEEKVPGLCEYLEGEYERIVAFTRELMSGAECDFMGDIYRIPVILSNEKPAPSVHMFSEAEIARMIRLLADRRGDNLSEEEIRKILSRKYCTIHTCGRYIHTTDSSPYIIIYYKNISCRSRKDYKAKLAHILAHEYFHFIHDSYAGISRLAHDKEEKSVQESLADFFSLLYLIDTHIPSDAKGLVAVEKYNWWDSLFGSDIAYADALWYYHIDRMWYGYMDTMQDYFANGCILKFFSVFRESRRSMNGAYRILEN